MSFSLDCPSMFVSCVNQSASWYAKATSSDIFSRIKDVAIAAFSNFYQMCTKAEAHTNEINVKTGAWLGCAALLIIIAAGIIRVGRHNGNQVP